MRRSFCLILALLLALTVCACGGDAPAEDAPEAPADWEAPSPDADDGPGLDAVNDVQVNAAGSDVTITVPPAFLDEDVTQAELDARARENGFQSITLHDDGSATYVMTQAQHAEMMADIRQGIEESLDAMVSSGEYPNIVAVETSDDYTLFTVFIEASAVGVNESMAALGFYVFGSMYHVFNGTVPDNICIRYVNAATGDVLDELNSSDMAAAE